MWRLHEHDGVLHEIHRQRADGFAGVSKVFGGCSAYACNCRIITAVKGLGPVPNFVEFSRQDSRSSLDHPMFTLQRRGLISLNHAAFLALGEPPAVALLYDADEGIIALRKVDDTYPNGYQVRKQANSRSYLVGAQGFTSFNKIEAEVPKRFMGHEYADDIWGFVLDEGTAVTARTRGAHRSAEPSKAT